MAVFKKLLSAEKLPGALQETAKANAGEVFVMLPDTDTLQVSLKFGKSALDLET